MSRSPKGGKGYFIRDDRASGGTLVELHTLTCAHCNRVVALNPARTRERGYCSKCYSYVCDTPACNLDCTPVLLAMEYSMEDQRLSPFATDDYNRWLLTNAFQARRVY